MDLITQGLTGALLAQSVARAPQLKYATVIGAIAGMLPDADILIRAADDPLFGIEYHRHFTHALLFAPFGALLVSFIAWLFLRASLGFGSLYVFSLLGMMSGGLLDACTSFGTHLLWPFSDERISWNLIAIIDPVFSLILLIALVLALRWHNTKPARIGVSLALMYLLLGYVQHERAVSVVRELLAQQRGHTIERMEVKPTMANNVLWRSVYLSDGMFHVDAVRVGWFGARRHYEGAAIAQLAPDDISAVTADSMLHTDIRRFDRLVEQYLVRHPEHPDVLGDIRYAMLPHSIRPLWGIRVDMKQPNSHVEFITLREMNAELRATFFSMLLAEEVGDSGQ